MLTPTPKTTPSDKKKRISINRILLLQKRPKTLADSLLLEKFMFLSNYHQGLIIRILQLTENIDQWILSEFYNKMKENVEILS